MSIMNMNLLDLVRNCENFSGCSVICGILILLLGFLIFRLQCAPPGPWGLPVLGLWPFLEEKTAHLQLQKYTEKYGDVYSFRYAGTLFIHLGNTKAAKEALVTKSDCFVDRNSGVNILNSFFGGGLLAINGEPWKVVRKFFVNAFREYGMTTMKDYMTGPILDSVNSVVVDFQARKGKPFDIISVLTLRSSEIVRRVLFNDEVILEEEMKEILVEYEKIIFAFVNTNMLLNGRIAGNFIFPYIKSYRTAKEGHIKCVTILKQIIARHEATFDPNSVRNMIDSYIKERNDRRNKGDLTAEYFTEEALISSLLQFVGDGISSVAIFIAYFVNALVEYPEEEEKIYKELDEVIGSDRQPTLQDKSKLPYFNAFLQEVQRTMHFINLFSTMECTKETTINGYNIPKGAILMLNIYACHRNPKFYDEPDKFKPSRYIVEPGQQKPDAPILFGIGKRSCIGEPFTLMQTFLFLSTVIKNFRLALPAGAKKREFPGIVMEICAHPRR